MYFIATGACVVEQKDLISIKSKTLSIVNLKPGDYFGVRVKIIYFHRSCHYYITATDQRLFIPRAIQPLQVSIKDNYLMC